MSLAWRGFFLGVKALQLFGSHRVDLLLLEAFPIKASDNPGSRFSHSRQTAEIGRNMEAASHEKERKTPLPSLRAEFLVHVTSPRGRGMLC